MPAQVCTEGYRPTTIATLVTLLLDTAAPSPGTNMTPSSHPMPYPMPRAARGLSSRELEVLRLMSDGLSNQEIADALCVSVRTVAGHVANILGKLDLTSRTAAVALAIRSGLA